MNKNNIYVFCIFYGFLFIIIGLNILFIPSNSTKKAITSNANYNKTLSVNDMEDMYYKLEKKTLITTFYSDFYQAVENAKISPTSFKGKLTHYGPDCTGCGGTTACKGINVKNGNIYYNDPQYGKVRIVAADRKLPCGSIIKINISKYDVDGMYAIVLDRGGGVNKGHIDLLKTSQKARSPVRTTRNVTFDIIRLGYAKK